MNVLLCVSSCLIVGLNGGQDGLYCSGDVFSFAFACAGLKF